MQGKLFHPELLHSVLLLLALGAPCVAIQMSFLYLKKPRPLCEAVSIIIMMAFLLTAEYRIGHGLPLLPQLASYANEQ